MADETKLIISIETILRGLDRTLRGLSQVEKQLKRVATVTTGPQGAANVNRATAATQKLQQQQQRAAVSAQRLAQSQQAVSIRAQQLANAQTRATQTTQRLTQAQQRLNTVATSTARGLTQQADAHVRAFRALEAASRRASERVLAVGNSLRSVGQGLTSVGATLSVAVTIPLIGLGAAMVNAATELDSLKRGLAAISGSSDEAGRQLARLTQVAKLPGIGFQEAIQGSIRLQAVGFSAGEAEKALREFSNAVALTGGGRDELNRITVQLGQMAAKGKVLSQDLRPIIEAAPAVGRALREAFGTVNPDDIRELGLSSEEFIRQLVSQLGQLPRAAAGAKNSFENFRDELFRAAATVGEVLLPSLTRLVEVAGPVITALANAFAALPQPLQVLVIGLGGLFAAFGPIAFVVGQLTTGVGRLLVGFAQLNLLGILPTIKNLKALVAGTLTAAQAQRTLAASSALVVGAVGGVVAIVATLITVYAVYKAFQKDSITLSKEQVSALTDQINGLKQQVKFIEDLSGGVERTASEQQRLLDIYNQLNLAAQTRITGIKDEDERLAALRQELQLIIRAREEERVQAAANLAATVTNNALLIAAEDEVVRSLALRVQANTELIQSLEATGQITPEVSKQLERFASVAGGNVTENLRLLREENARLVQEQNNLRNASKETRADLSEQVPVLRQMAQATGRTEAQLLVTAKTMGLFEGSVEKGSAALRAYIADTVEATRVTDLFAKTLDDQERDLLKAGEGADALAKKRKALIDAAGSLAREASDSFEGALKFMNAFIAAQPRLREAIEREAQIEGKSFGEVVDEALRKSFGRQKDRADSGAGLRSAQEQLAKALADVALAASDQQVKIENLKNERLLQQAESGQRLLIISYRQFLKLRAELARQNLDREIEQQGQAVKKAREEQLRLLATAQQPGVTDVERGRRQAQAAQANEEAIKAETRLNELLAQRDLITDSLTQALAELDRQQLTDVRQLEIRYAELQGRIEDALDAATVEEFRDSLRELGNTQEFLNEQLERAQRDRDAGEVKRIKAAKEQNQRQIEVINNQVAVRKGLAQLAAAERLVENARQRQSQLEANLIFQVEFRGLREEEAIRQRLEGERELRASLELSQSIIEDVVRSFVDLGRTPPPELQRFIDDLQQAKRGLGELPFAEQFRLAEKEFTRLNDERLQRIADVERAVRNRDIAEAEGLLFIRRINGQYVGDLERQLELLKQIAAASGDPTLRQQAVDAAEVAKDAADELATLNKQIRATSIDALRDGFTQFFTDLADSSQSAQEDLLSFINSVVARINQVIAENLSRKLVESIFGGADATNAGGGIFAAAKRLLGIGGGAVVGKGGVADIAGKAIADTGAAAAAATLQAGAATAATTTTTSAVTFSTSVTTAAAGFAATIAAAGAAFAAAVSAASGAQAVSGAAAGAGSGIGNFATGDILPAKPGGRIVRVAEAGHAEAVLTADPRHSLKQARILRQFLRMTRGLQGRFPTPMAEGGIISARQAEVNLLNGVTRTPQLNATLPESALAGTAPVVNVRNINQINRGELVRGYLRSAEGVQDILNVISENAPDIGRRIGVR